jgi:hypothetical protein
MVVLKCKDCEGCHVFKYPSGANYRQCRHEKIGNRCINANEYKTSPKWCPKRIGV